MFAGIRRAEQVDELKDNNDDDLKPMTTSRKLSFSKTFTTDHADLSHPYELVGVVVHSGQANAGTVTYLAIIPFFTDVSDDVSLA